MGETKKLSIKNQTYYYLDDMSDIRNFHSHLLRIDKKYIGTILVALRLKNLISLVIMKIFIA